MSEWITRIVAAPTESPVLALLSLAYTLVESIRIYDARLIQAKTRGFYSGVAVAAMGRSLPAWVSYIHFLGWVLLVTIVFMNWQYAIVLYALLFVLRVLPVLENIGAVIMSPFLTETS